ncbi:translocase of chloroplast 159, chloroplastic-like [Typha latifolia]|uniref:translocase of chloroplast 159, chloroplastic-like n=1 Tax=Typha latifolia TaxID=4733 RepID=UPI003C2F5919
MPMASSASFVIRAPLSSQDEDDSLLFSDASEGESFESASASDGEMGARPKAQITGLDEEEEEEDLDDGDGFSGVARVALRDQVSILADKGEGFEGEGNDPSLGNRLSGAVEREGAVDGSKGDFGQSSKDESLRVEEEDLIKDEAIAVAAGANYSLGGEEDDPSLGTQVSAAVDGGIGAESSKDDNLGVEEEDLIKDEAIAVADGTDDSSLRTQVSVAVDGGIGVESSKDENLRVEEEDLINGEAIAVAAGADDSLAGEEDDPSLGTQVSVAVDSGIGTESSKDDNLGVEEEDLIKDEAIAGADGADDSLGGEGDDPSLRTQVLADVDGGIGVESSKDENLGVEEEDLINGEAIAVAAGADNSLGGEGDDPSLGTLVLVAVDSGIGIESSKDDMADGKNLEEKLEDEALGFDLENLITDLPSEAADSLSFNVGSAEGDMKERNSDDQDENLVGELEEGAAPYADDRVDSNSNLESVSASVSGIDGSSSTLSMYSVKDVGAAEKFGTETSLGAINGSGKSENFKESYGLELDSVNSRNRETSGDITRIYSAEKFGESKPDIITDGGDMVSVLEVVSSPNLSEAEVELVGRSDLSNDRCDYEKTDERQNVGDSAFVAAVDGDIELNGENSIPVEQHMEESEEGSPNTSIHSGMDSSRDCSQKVDGQIVSDSDEEVDDYEEGDAKEVFDSAALAALLKAVTGSSPDGSVIVTSQDSSRIFSVDSAGLGSAPQLRPAPPIPARPNYFAPSEPEIEVNDEEKKLHEKVEQIRVKFLWLIHRLGYSPEDTVAMQVLHRLSLAEGIRRGRQTNHAFSLAEARKKAVELEGKGKEDLDFSCNILVLGATGVGKSATINSIFGEEKSQTNAFGPATASVREIVGTVDGVKIRIIDTPGLKSSGMDQALNRKILLSVKKYTKRCPPDIVLYVDRMDTHTRDFNDLPLLRSITSTLGSSIWFKTIIALTHAAAPPPYGPSGSQLSYDMFVAKRSHLVQQVLRQAAGDMRLMNPVGLVENHSSCRMNAEGERVLPNGVNWRPQMLLLCYSSKMLSEADSLIKLQDPSPGKLYGFRFRSPPLPSLLSSLLQSKAHPKLSTEQDGANGDSDIDLDDLDADQEDEEDEYDQLPPFKPLKKTHIAKLSKEQRRAYFDEYDYRVKLLQKKQWKEELRRLREIKKRGKGNQDGFASSELPEDFDQENAPSAVPVPLPDMVLPPSFDCDCPTYRYRFLEPTSQLLARPVMDRYGWDHDCGYDGVSLEESLAVAGRFPAVVSVQVTKDKKEFSIHLDSSISAKHGENGSTLAGFDVQPIGQQLAYVFRGETKFKNFKKNKTTGGISVTFLGDTVATGMKIEDQLSVGKRVALVASTGAVRAQRDTAFGANLEARLHEKNYPIGEVLSTLGLSLMRWRSDLALGANLQSQLSVGRSAKMAVHIGLNNKLSGQITVRTSTSEQLQIALVGILPIVMSIFNSLRSGGSFSC